jgi:hypothetical protein
VFQGESNRLVYELCFSDTASPMMKIEISLLLLFIGGAEIFAQTAPGLRVAAASEITEEMQRQKNLGYNILATANGARFSSQVILSLIELVGKDKPARPVLIRHADIFHAYLKVTGFQVIRLRRSCACLMNTNVISISIRGATGC